MTTRGNGVAALLAKARRRIPEKAASISAAATPDARAAHAAHIIDLADMLKFIDDAGARWMIYASDGWKRVEFRHAGGYRVRVRGAIVYEGMDGSTAVRRYNEAT